MAAVQYPAVKIDERGDISTHHKGRFASAKKAAIDVELLIDFTSHGYYLSHGAAIKAAIDFIDLHGGK